MFPNYFKTAWRSLRKNRTFSILNIIGLSIGVACSLLIALYVLDESSYDRFNTQADRIYRIDEQVKFGDFGYNGAWVPAIMGPGFATDFTQIERYTRLKYNPDVVIRKGGESIKEDRAVFAYRITIGWWMFVEVGAICLLIALITISSQVIKAALANPVKSLRAE